MLQRSDCTYLINLVDIAAAYVIVGAHTFLMRHVYTYLCSQKINSENLLYYRKRANCSHLTRNFSAAVDDCRKIVAMMPGSMEDRKAFVRALLTAGQIEEAIQGENAVFQPFYKFSWLSSYLLRKTSFFLKNLSASVLPQLKKWEINL